MIIEINKSRIFLSLVIDLAIFLGAAIAVVIPVFLKVVEGVNNHGLGTGLLVSSGYIVLCVLWFMLLSLLIQNLKFEIKMLHLSMVTENNDIVISCGNFEYRIPQNSLRYVLDGNKGVMLIWNSENGVKTFLVRKFFFDKDTYGKFVGELMKFSGYCKDSGKKKEIIKEHKLDHIFRKNKLESAM
ncbi:MAG: hypothetical protein ABSG82_08730 [Sedimentisphaerales bacterium]|jgi:hypothetical protein